MKSLPEVSLSDIDELFDDEKKTSLKEIDEIFKHIAFMEKNKGVAMPTIAAPVSTIQRSKPIPTEEEIDLIPPSEKFNTQLEPDDEKKFQYWLNETKSKYGVDLSKDLEVYDLRGYWKSGGSKDDAFRQRKGHAPDTFKKPTHPTFSEESIYHDTIDESGRKYEGGRWEGEKFIPPEKKPEQRLTQALEDIELAYPTIKPEPPEEPPRVFESLAENVKEPLLHEIARGIGKALDIGPRSILGGAQAGGRELEKVYQILEEQGITGVPEAVLRSALGITHGMFGTMMGTSPSGLAFLGTQETIPEVIPEAGPIMQKTMAPVSTTAELLGQMVGIPPSREELGGMTGAVKDIGDLFGMIYGFTKTHKRVSEAGKTKQELAFIDAQPKFEKARPEGAASEKADYLKEVEEWSAQFEKEFPNLYKRVQAKLRRNEPLTPGEKNVIDSFTRKMMRRQIPTTKETPVTDDEALELLQGITDAKGQRMYSDDQIARMSSGQRIYYASGGRQGSKELEKPKKAEGEVPEIVGREVVPTKPLEIEEPTPEKKVMFREGDVTTVKAGDLEGVSRKVDVDDLKSEIAKSGKVRPIEITKTGFIVDGYHRYQALIELGVEDIPVYVGEQMGKSGRLKVTYPGLMVGVKIPKIPTAPEEVKITEPIKAPPTKKGKKTTVKEPENIVESNVEEYQKRSTDIDTEYETAWDEIKKLTDDINKARSMKIVGGEGSEEPLKKQIDVLMKRRAEIMKQKGAMDQKIGETISKKLEEQAPELDDESHSTHIEKAFEWVENPALKGKKVSQVIDEYIDKEILKTKTPKPAASDQPEFKEPERIAGTEPAEIKIIKEPEKYKESEKLKVYDVPISMIRKDVDAFQNRSTEYSEESVNKILDDIEKGTFKYYNYDPIILWRNPDDGELYTFNHSRVEAFSRANESMSHMGEYSTIPAKIIEGVSKEEAILIAKRSNARATKELPIERAKYYRDLREQGKSEKEVEDEAKIYDGKASQGLINLSYLNPKGRTVEAIRMIGEEGGTANEMRDITEWIGYIRRITPELTDIHESEMFDWLKTNYKDRGIGIKNRPQFVDTIERVTNVKEGFDYSKKLNLDTFIPRDKTAREYLQKIEDAKLDVKVAEEVLANKEKEFIARRDDPAVVDKALTPYREAVIVAKRDLMYLKDNKEKVLKELADTELNLFDDINKLEERMRDEEYSETDIRGIEEGRITDTAPEGTPPEEAPPGTIPGKAGKAKKRVIKDSTYLDAKKRLDDKLIGNLSGFFFGDPESIADIIKIGAYHIESGVRTLDEFRPKIKYEFGPFFDRLSGRVEEIFKRSIAYWKECYVLDNPEFSKSIDKSNLIDENGIPIPVNSDRFNRLFDEKFKKLLSVPETKEIKIESWNNVIGESVKRFKETGGISPGMATVDISKYPKGNLATGEKVAYILEPIFEKAKYEATMLIRQGKLTANDFSDYVHRIVNDMLLSNKAFNDMSIEDRNLFYREIRSRGDLYRYNPDSRILDEVSKDIQTSTESSLDALLTPQVKSDFGESDLNNVLTLRQIGKNFANNLNKVPGKDVRFGLIKRFRRAIGLYFGNSGLIRLRNINELDVFAHEVGHQIDAEVFDYTGKIKFDQADAIEKALVLHLGRYLTQGPKRKVKDLTAARQKLMDNLYKKYGRDVVDGIDHRFQMRQELKKHILSDFPVKSPKIEEGIAQFVNFYVVNPERAAKDAPLFHTFFESLLFENEPLKSALHAAREQFKEYKTQDPRQLYESKVVRRSDDGNNWLAGITKLFGKQGLYYNIVNSLAPIRDLGEKLKEFDPKSPPSENPYAKVLSVFGAEGKQKQFLENHPFRKTGEDIEILYDIPPLLEILSKMVKDNTLRSHESFLDAMRDLDLYEAGKGGAALMPKKIAEETVKLFRQSNSDEYADNLVRDLKKYNDSVIDYYQASGKLSKKTADQMKEIYNVYVPYKRFFDEYESSGGTINLGKKVADSSPSPVKVIRKSVREIHSPIESLVKNTYDLIVSADRNDALKSLVQGLDKLDEHLVQEIPAQVVTPVKVLENGNIELKFALEFKKPQNAEIITIWSDGKPHYYQIPKDYYDSFFSVYEPYSKALRKLAMPTNLLRAGAVVYDPTFGFRNIPRDQISGIFYSKYGYNPYHFFQGVFNAFNKTEYYQKFLASGSDLSFLATLDKAVDYSQSRLKSASHLESLWKRYMHPSGFMSLAQDFNRTTELGTRVGSFRNAYIRTGNVHLAMEEARNIGGDYSIQGATMKNISPLYAFLNARMRHDENTLRSFGVKRIAKTTGKGLAWISSTSVLLWLWNNLDPERRKLYRELPLWRKSQFFNIPIPGTDNFLPVPKGFYGTLFGSIPEAVLEYTFNEEMKQGKDFPRALFNEFSPMSDVMDAVPTFTRPIAEQFANKIAYTDRAIVPGTEKIAPEEQYTDLTPEFIKEIGKMISVSPARIEAFITGYTAGAGRNTLYITDEILQLIGVVDKKPEDTFNKLSRMPITRAFIGRSYIGARSESAQSFYRKLDDLETINNTVNRMIRDNKGSELNQYMKGHEADYRYYIKNQKEINRFKDLIRGVRDLQIDMVRKGDEDRFDKAKGMDWTLTEIAQRFNESYSSGHNFTVGSALSNIRLKHKKEEKKEKHDIRRFKQKYKNPQFQQ